MKTRMNWLKLALVLAVALCWLALRAPQTAYAATITVNTTADEFDTGADCSLRKAIQAANTDAAFGGCSAGSGDDNIILPAGTYMLTIPGTNEDSNVTGDLDIASNITIIGAGATQTIIDGNSVDRVLHIVSGNVGLQGLTIQGGNPGGTFLGGGIYRLGGNLTISDSIIQENQAPSRGGGIASLSTGTLTINRTAFLNNESTSAIGGGLLVDSSTATLTNVTMSGNSASNGGGAITVRAGGSLEINHGTFDGNTSGTGASAIRNDASVTLRNTIISGVSNLCSGTFVVDTILSDDSTCGALANPVTNFDDILRDNGGPTLTYALLPGSNAIDAGNNATCASTDQRGLSRPVDYDRDSTATCDIGAFERQAAETFTATVNDGDTQTFGATLTTIVDNAGGNAPGNVTIVRQNQPPGGGAPNQGEMPFHVNITAATSTGLDINLTLCYTDWEVSQGNAVTESGLTLYRWNGSSWVDQGVDTLDITTNCATKNNVTDLSSWTLASGPPVPTAVNLQSFTVDNNPANWVTLGALLLLISGSTLLIFRRRQTSA